MSQENHPHQESRRWVEGYNTMLERVSESVKHLTEATQPRLHQALEIAKDKAYELGELTREEAEKISEYLRRDVEDAANFLTSDEAKDLAAWFRFDLERTETRLVEMFFSVADQTKLDLVRLQQQVEHPFTYHTGEMTTVGTLICTQCGKLYHFDKTGHIPPCSACNNTLFERVSEELGE